MIKIIHFSDAHIDMSPHGKKEPSSGLPFRVLDYLTALDKIIDTAINSSIDLVIFTGDAYRDRSPSPTYQREWGKRMIRLSNAGIPTLLIVGNHDISPAFGRAHALQEYDTLSIPNILVADKPIFIKSGELHNLPIQIIALPWISTSGMLALNEANLNKREDINSQLEHNINGLIQNWISEADPEIPLILAAHASVQGAVFGSERNITLGNDYILSGSLVRNPAFDYVALGHIHKAQNLNEDAHPPVVYSGSIEKVDFGELEDQKYFVIGEIEKGKTIVNWIPLSGRHFSDKTIDIRILAKLFGEGKIPEAKEVLRYIEENLPDQEEILDAIARLTLIYPQDWEPLIDNNQIQTHYKDSFEIQIIKKPQVNMRLRLAEDESIGSLSPIQLLEKYLLRENIDQMEIQDLRELASKIIYNQDDLNDLEVGL